MKGKKIVVIFVIIILLAAGWILSIKKITGIDQRNAQNVLLEDAEGFADKKLYIRAIPLYEEALQYPTDRVPWIEERLLHAYQQHGDEKPYIALIEKRIEAGRAADTEYVAAAEYYLEKYEADTAMTLIKQGMDTLNSEKLQEFYEQNRYAYDMHVTEYEKIMPTWKNETMPAYDGSSWVYIDRSGRDIKIGVFELAFPFNEQEYAIVKQDHTYYTILPNGDRYSVDENALDMVLGWDQNNIVAKKDGKYEEYDIDFQKITDEAYEETTICQHGMKAVRKDGKWSIVSATGRALPELELDDVAVNSLGEVFAGEIGVVEHSGAWYFIDTEGKDILENGFTAAKAPESKDGLIAVADESGKWGFADQNGKLVIACQYDDARSFSDALGAVRSGKNWYYISEQGKKIIDMGFEDAQPFHNGVAQAKIEDGAVLIILDYFEE